MVRTALALLVLAAFLGSGLLHGVWTGRWGSAADLEACALRLQEVPMTIGDWDGYPLEEGELPHDLRGRTIARTYKNRLDGREVVFRLVCGRRGSMLFSHTPVDCFPAVGFVLMDEPVNESLAAEAGGGEFLRARFSKMNMPAPQHLEIHWSWSGDGSWRVPEYPRLVFADFPVLYKLYVARPLVSGGEPVDGNPGGDFLRAMLPQLNEVLFAGR
jgi:hypothetical protein